MKKSEQFYKKGDVVWAPFPYKDDADKSKERPVLLLSPDLYGNAFICAFITSKSNEKPGMIRILRRDFKEGYINDNYEASYIRPDIVYTLNKSLIETKCGTLKDEVVDKVIETLIELLQKPPEVPPVPKSLERPPKRTTF